MGRRDDQGRDVVDIGAPSPEEIINKIRQYFKGGSSGIIAVIAILLLLWLGFSTVYTIGVDEVGVVQRFGKYVRTTTPGLHVKLPSGFEKLTKVKVKSVYTAEFGFRTLSAGIKTQYAPSRRYKDEYLMLTGDLNSAVVPWIVQFRIGDPYKYLFKVRDVQKTLHDLSEAAMRQVVGDRSINEVINKRKEISDRARVLLQEALNDADTGISLVAVELKRTNVPDEVQPSFNEVNQATQEKEKLIYQAREAYNKAVPRAKGEAEKTIREAEGYALDRINRAKGDANRFIAIYNEYKVAKDVTRRRMYLEAMNDVIPKLGNKYIVDPEQKGFLPFLNLDKKGKDNE